MPPSDIEILLRESRDEGVALDETTLLTLERAIERAAIEFAAKPDELDRLERWEEIVSLVREAQVKVDLRKPQNEYYRMRKAVRPVFAATAGNGSPNATRWLQRFDAPAHTLPLSPHSPRS